MDKLFSSNVEDKEVLFKKRDDEQNIKDVPPKSAGEPCWKTRNRPERIE